MSTTAQTKRRRHPSPAFMAAYHAARHAWVMACELDAVGYRQETADYKAAHPPMLFKRWLIESRGITR